MAKCYPLRAFTDRPLDARLIRIKPAAGPRCYLPPMTTEPLRLRKRAQWYREFAKLGTMQERVWRQQMADYFDRLAEEIEKKDGEAK